ncbi:MAG: hypothetical protein ISN29_02045 [Gammaproteobacteria bacterium AqS3]|nr:hypothetical protein [Gammaproteobacteria bacterium AqS3]
MTMKHPRFERRDEYVGAVIDVGVNWKRAEVGSNWEFTEAYLSDTLLADRLRNDVADRERNARRDPPIKSSIDTLVEVRLDITIDEDGNITGKVIPMNIGRGLDGSIERIDRNESFKSVMAKAIKLAIEDNQETPK